VRRRRQRTSVWKQTEWGRGLSGVQRNCNKGLLRCPPCAPPRSAVAWKAWGGVVQVRMTPCWVVLQPDTLSGMEYSTSTLIGVSPDFEIALAGLMPMAMPMYGDRCSYSLGFEAITLSKLFQNLYCVKIYSPVL